MGWEPSWCLLLCLAVSGAAGTDPPTEERRWQAVDIVLDCFLVTEDKHRGAFGSSEDREKALLVLKQVPVLDDGSLEGFTDFQGSAEARQDSPVIFEASVDLVQIPQAEALLHADCSGKAVTCEIAQYFLQARQEATFEKADWFISNMQVSRGGPSVSIVMKTLRDDEAGAVRHPSLNIPLSPQGTVKTKVEFQVTAETQTLNHLLGSSVSLPCSFSMAPGLDLTGVEWRLQHKGSGQLVYSWKTGQGQAKRKGATLKPEKLLRAGDASLTLPNLTLKDEGNYICQISTSLYQAQQIVPLNILASPKVQLILANKDPLPSLVCSIAGYYPLDVVVTWIREELGGIPAQVSGASFSSLRQNMMGTYSISSTVTAEPGPTGATYTCQVAHVSLEEPLTVSMRVLPNTVAASTTMNPQPPNECAWAASRGQGVLSFPTRSWKDTSRQAGKKTHNRSLSPAQAQQEWSPEDWEHSPCENQMAQEPTENLGNMAEAEEQRGALGVIVASILFLFALLLLGLHRQQASSSKSTKSVRHSE